MAKSNSIRSQYAKESAYIRRRLKDIAKVAPDSLIVKRYENEFPALRDFKLKPSDKAIELGLEKMKELRASGVLSTKAQRRSRRSFISTLNKRGYTFINEENFEDLTEFLDDARARHIADIFGYEKILEAVHLARSKGLSDEEIKDNIDFWEKHANDKKYTELTVRRRPKQSDSDSISKRVRRHKR